MQSSRAFVTHVPSSAHPESAAGSSGAGGWLDADASLPSSERSPHRADRRQPLTRSLMALMVCSALAACGGGGGGGSAVNTNPDPQAVTPVTPSVPPSANNQGAQGNNGTNSQNGTSSDSRGQGSVAGGNAASGNSSQSSAGNGNQNGTTGGSTSTPGTGNGSGNTGSGASDAPVGITPPNLPGNDADPKSQKPTAAIVRILGQVRGPSAAANPASLRLPQGSTSIAYDRQDPPRIWVINPDQDSVSVLDSKTRTLLREIPLTVSGRTETAPEKPASEHGPRTLAIDNAGHVWVANRHSGSISIIDPATMTVTTRIALGVATQPYGVVAAPDGSGIWVSTLGSQELLQFDPVTRQLKQRMALGPEVRHLAITADSKRLLASRFITPALPGESTLTPRTRGTGFRGGEVLLIDPARATLQRAIPLAVSTLEDTPIQGRGLPNYLGAAAISPDGRSAWIPSKQDNIQRGQSRDGQPLDFQSTVRAIVSNLDLQAATPAERPARRYDVDNSGQASAATYTPDGRYVLVALETSREISILNAATGTEVRRLDVQRTPQGIAVSPDGKQAAVSNVMSRTVSFFDISALANDEPRAILPATATGTLKSAERMPAQLKRGKELFHDARDPRLARDRYMSCASCHSEGYGDGRVWDMSSLGEGLRKTISLQGHGGKKARLHWSGNFDEVQDFEQQIRALGGGSGLMPIGSFELNGRNLPLGTPKAGQSDDLDALAAYVNSLNRYAPSPYRNSDRSLTASAKTGEALFASKGCTTCHSNADLGGDGLTRHDIGTLKPASGKVQGEALTGLVAPSLRDAWYTAPYLHDGSADTLEAAIQAHNTNTFTAAELSSLAAYIRQLGNGQ